MAQVSGKRSALIAGLVFCLALAAWLIDETRIETAALQKTVREAVTPFMVEDVAEVYLRNPRMEAQLVLRDGKWEITSPYAVAADQDVMITLLTNWCNARRRNEFKIEAGASPAAYGLEQPEYEIRFTSAPPQPRTTTVVAGAQTSTGDYYAMEPGTDRVFILDEILRHNMARNLYQLRDKRLFQFDVEQAAAVRIETTSRTIALERTGGEWRVTAPFEYPAERATVRNLLATISGIEVSDFATTRTAEILPLVGLDEPVGAVQVQLAGGGELLRMEFGHALREERRIWVRRVGRPDVAQLDFGYLRQLFIAPERFRRSKVFSLQFEELALVAVDLGRSQFTLEKHTGGWALAGKPEFEVDPQEVASRLGGLLDLRVLRFETEAADELSSYGLAEPRMRLALGTADGAVETLLVGRINPADKLEIFAKTAELPDVFTLSVLEPHTFYWIEDDFRLKRVFDFATSAPAKVEFELPPWPTAEITLAGQVWQFRLRGAGRGKNIPASSAQALLAGLSDLRYATALSKPPLDTETTGMTTPTLTLSVYGGGGELLGELRRGGVSNDEYFAVRDGRDWFKIPPGKFLGLEAAMRTLLPERK